MDAVHPRRRLTRNRMGWSSDQLNPLSVRVIDEVRAGLCRDPHSPLLDIGAAFGLFSLAALDAGAHVVANDLDPSHLAALPPHPRLALKPGHFPRDLHFEPASLGAVHASRVFHFLTPRQLERGFRLIARWLRPGGRLFVETASPYQEPFQSFLPEFERRVLAADPWPGWIPKVSLYSSHRQLSQMPRSLHLLDDATLARAAANAGLTVAESYMYTRADLPQSLRLDGREASALVAVRP